VIAHKKRLTSITTPVPLLLTFLEGKEVTQALGPKPFINSLTKRNVLIELAVWFSRGVDWDRAWTQHKAATAGLEHSFSRSAWTPSRLREGG
jgi:hypothetical protein